MPEEKLRPIYPIILCYTPLTDYPVDPEILFRWGGDRRKRENMKKRRKWQWCFYLLLGLAACAGMGEKTTAIEVQAKVKVLKKDRTPVEPANSDLKIVHPVTKLASRRWIQSFTMDSQYYYYIQMTRPSHGDLRITRIKYRGLGKYSKAKMDLKGFGHATNLDCSVYNGKTYLWTGSNAARGSDVSRAVSCFPFRKNSILRKKGPVYYRIPLGRNGKYVTNVYPAVNADSTELGVRFTYKNKQYYQIYRLTNGTQINVGNPLQQVIVPMTSGDFQGFDLDNHTICTIEGSPRKSFLRGYDRRRVYQPTIIRKWNYATGQMSSRVIRGAKRLSFREPEGVKLFRNGKMQIMYVSHQLTNQSCNIYEVK